MSDLSVSQVKFESAPGSVPSSDSKKGAEDAKAKNLELPLLLLVDDETDLRDIIAFDLKRKGYRILTASGGHEAWKIYSQNKVDLVITDIRMPEGDGLGLLQKVSQSETPCPVICLTGFAEISNEDILKLGARAIFEKPFERKKFYEAVEANSRK